MQRGKTGKGPQEGRVAPDRLFLALADYLRAPLFNIARGAELNHLADAAAPGRALAQIGITAANALNLLDSYVLAEQARDGQIKLALEPVAVAAVLYDTAHELDALAKTYNCELQVTYQHRQPLVMAYRPALRAALLSLGQVFLESNPQTDKKSYLNLSAYHGRGGVATGVFGKSAGLGRQMYLRAMDLSGRARMPLNNFTNSAGAGVFVAEALFASMSARLRVTRHNNLNGLAAALLPSRQLSLI